MAGFECPPHYLRTIPGLLKIVEIVLTILTFAISFGCPWGAYGGGWVEFAGITSFIVISIWFILHLINIIPQIFVNYPFELISYCVMTLILFIAGIVAAVKAGWRWTWPICASTIGATAFFGLASAVACGVDVFLLFLEYRKGNAHSSSSATTTVTTTTTSASATQVQY